MRRRSLIFAAPTLLLGGTALSLERAVRNSTPEQARAVIGPHNVLKLRDLPAELVQAILPGLALSPGFFGNSVFVGYSTEYTSGTHTVSVPSGAVTATIEGIGRGGTGYFDDSNLCIGGGGGGYSKTNNYSLTGVSALWVGVGTVVTNSEVRLETGVGTVIVRADTAGRPWGATTVSAVGDVKRSGGDGKVDNAFLGAGGGGAGGPTSNGTSSTGTTGGAGGGSPAGAGGNATFNGADYGGGGSSWVGGGSEGTRGTPGGGWIKITWA